MPIFTYALHAVIVDACVYMLLFAQLHADAIQTVCMNPVAPAIMVKML